MNANNPMPTKVKIKPDLFLMLFITAILSKIKFANIQLYGDK